MKGDRTYLPVSGLKGPRVAKGHIRYSRMLNNERGFGAELNQSPGVQSSYWGTAREPEKNSI